MRASYFDLESRLGYTRVWSRFKAVSKQCVVFEVVFEDPDGVFWMGLHHCDVGDSGVSRSRNVAKQRWERAAPRLRWVLGYRPIEEGGRPRWLMRFRS